MQISAVGIHSKVKVDSLIAFIPLPVKPIYASVEPRFKIGDAVSEVRVPLLIVSRSILREICRLSVDIIAHGRNHCFAVLVILCYKRFSELFVIIIEMIEPRAGAVDSHKARNAHTVRTVVIIVMLVACIIPIRNTVCKVEIPYCGHINMIVSALLIHIAARFQIAVDILGNLLHKDEVYPRIHINIIGIAFSARTHNGIMYLLHMSFKISQHLLEQSRIIGLRCLQNEKVL